MAGAQIEITCSVGFCLASRAPQQTGRGLLDAAQLAADEALRNGPGGIRAYTPGMAATRADQAAQRDELETALDEGRIRAHFQPQVSTDTGEITGFEALARWHHAERGLVSPAEFLPAIDDAGLSERLSEVMLYNAMTALARWDKAGLGVPSVAVNFSAAELRNPRLPEKIKWELDRFGLEPQRLTVEILETVVARADNDVIVRNVATLAALGCGVDLDDFGTGHASITNIRRLQLRRLKIDRSFVARVDEDRNQQQIVSAILSMAERLGLDTLAEGSRRRESMPCWRNWAAATCRALASGGPWPSKRRRTGFFATAPGRRRHPASETGRADEQQWGVPPDGGTPRRADCARSERHARRRHAAQQRDADTRWNCAPNPSAAPCALAAQAPSPRGNPLDLLSPPLLKHR